MLIVKVTTGFYKPCEYTLCPSLYTILTSSGLWHSCSCYFWFDQIIWKFNDVICIGQMITMTPSDSLDIIRTLRMAGFGLIILGTAQHLWFNFMGRVLPKRDLVSTLKKLLIGNCAYGPLINSAFFSFNAALQGKHSF